MTITAPQPVETTTASPMGEAVRAREVSMDALFDLAAATEAYAAYLNAPRGVLDPAEQRMFDEDLAKARAAVEMAWLQAKPVRQPD